MNACITRNSGSGITRNIYCLKSYNKEIEAAQYTFDRLHAFCRLAYRISARQDLAIATRQCLRDATLDTMSLVRNIITRSRFYVCAIVTGSGADYFYDHDVDSRIQAKAIGRATFHEGRITFNTNCKILRRLVRELDETVYLNG